LKSYAQRVARFGVLTALALVLGWLDRAIPVTWFLSGAVPGIKLGLANTVLLYAVYLMDWKGCVLLMLAKVFLSGFMFGSMSAILYSLSGGALSLAVMLLVRRRPGVGALVIALLAAASDAMLLIRNPHPRGQMLWCVILIALACLAALAAFFIIGRRPDFAVLGTSLAGAVAHNIGQILAASAMLRTPQLLYTYLPVLVGIGAVVGCLTGIVAQRVFKALRVPTKP
jgi:uncharacterized membrane protein